MNAIHSLLTLPGNVIAALTNHFTDDRAGIGAILQQLIVRQLQGSEADEVGTSRLAVWHEAGNPRLVRRSSFPVPRIRDPK